MQKQKKVSLKKISNVLREEYISETRTKSYIKAYLQGKKDLLEINSKFKFDRSIIM